MNRANRCDNILCGAFQRRLIIATISLFGAGCWGEPEPYRSNDPEKARAAIRKKSENPNIPPGLPKKSLVR